MKVLFDTNVILDIWGKTPDFVGSFTSYDIAAFKNFEPCIAATMMPDFVYLLSARKLMSERTARDAFEILLETFEVIDVVESDCRRAHASAMPDLEDAIIAHAAERNNVDLIVTRNKKDFLASPVPALAPFEFVNLYKPTCLNYELIDL